MSDNKSRTLIKLDDKIVEIIQGPKGLEAKELTEDEMFEISLLAEGVDKLIENDINKITNEAYEELKRDFKNNLKGNVLGIIGFEKRWSNNWEVDNANGKNSLVTQYIGDKLAQVIKQEMDKMVSPDDISEMLKEAKKGLKKGLQDRFRRAVEDQVYDQLHSQAKTFVADIIKKQIVKYQKQAIKKTEVVLLGRSNQKDESDD